MTHDHTIPCGPLDAFRIVSNPELNSDAHCAMFRGVRVAGAPVWNVIESRRLDTRSICMAQCHGCMLFYEESVEAFLPAHLIQQLQGFTYPLGRICGAFWVTCERHAVAEGLRERAGELADAVGR